jgi:mannose-6-phosphate isomerase-like protein (cupin superfamily)
MSYVQKPFNTIKKHDVDMTLYESNSSDNGVVYEEVTTGHLQEFYNDVSIYQWFIVDGNGVFVIDDEKFPVNKHDLVTVPPKKRIHYFGEMKMVLVTSPRFNPDNETSGAHCR